MTVSRSAHATDAETQEVRFTFDELGLIYKSLQAVKTLGVLPPQGELIEGTRRSTLDELADWTL